MNATQALPRRMRVSAEEVGSTMSDLKARGALVVGVRFLADGAVSILVERRTQPR